MVQLAPRLAGGARLAKALLVASIQILLLLLAARTPGVSAEVKYCEDGWTHQEFAYPVSGGADPDYGSVANRKYGSHCYKALKLNTEGKVLGGTRAWLQESWSEGRKSREDLFLTHPCPTPNCPGSAYSWNSAQAACRTQVDSWGWVANLASIHSASEEGLVKGLYTSNWAWYGATRQAASGGNYAGGVFSSSNTATSRGWMGADGSRALGWSGRFV